MGFGSKSEPLPEPEPIEPVPQEEGSNKLEAQRRARTAALGREGFRAHTQSRAPGGQSVPANARGARGETIQGKSKMTSYDAAPTQPAGTGRRSRMMS